MAAKSIEAAGSFVMYVDQFLIPSSSTIYKMAGCIAFSRAIYQITHERSKEKKEKRPQPHLLYVQRDGDDGDVKT